MLMSEEKNENAEFCVKEVQYIQAEVCQTYLITIFLFSCYSRLKFLKVCFIFHLLCDICYKVVTSASTELLGWDIIFLLFFRFDSVLNSKFTFC